jgi:hypothetical protein
MEAIRLELADCCSAKEVAVRLLAIDDELQLRAALLLNNWWHERNRVRVGERPRSADEIAGLCGRQATEIRNLQGLSAVEPGLRNRRRKWARPPSGMLKLNVDGAFRESDMNGGWGYVIRDENGDVIQSGSGRVLFATSQMHMELIACIQGVTAAISLGINNLTLETDAQQVVWAIQGDDYRLAVVGGLVHELKVLLVEYFASFLVNYVPRECNRVAHELASIGSRSQELAPSILAGVPNCITFFVSSVLADMVE